MPTNILVPTADVNGNIGQCTTNTNVINCASRQGFFICNDVGYATNSCTGQTEVYHSWEFSEEAHTLFFLGGLLLVTIIVGMVVWLVIRWANMGY